MRFAPARPHALTAHLLKQGGQRRPQRVDKGEARDEREAVWRIGERDGQGAGGGRHERVPPTTPNGEASAPSPQLYLGLG